MKKYVIVKNSQIWTSNLFKSPEVYFRTICPTFIDYLYLFDNRWVVYYG